VEIIFALIKEIIVVMLRYSGKTLEESKTAGHFNACNKQNRLK
jgi:hypothetical protein